MNKLNKKGKEHLTEAIIVACTGLNAHAKEFSTDVYAEHDFWCRVEDYVYEKLVETEEKFPSMEE